MDCQRHGVNLQRMLETLRGATGSRPTAAPGPGIRADQVLGEILVQHPETEAVFRKYYGSGCFSCPGQATESVRQRAMIHNVDMEQLLADLNRAARAG